MPGFEGDCRGGGTGVGGGVLRQRFARGIGLGGMFRGAGRFGFGHFWGI